MAQSVQNRFSNRARSVLLSRTALGTALLVFSAAGAGVAAGDAAAQVTNVGTVTLPATATITGTGVGALNTSAAETTTITLGEARSILNWGSFDLKSNDTLGFVFADKNHIALNRVAAGSAKIDGALTANGNVWFSAADGVVIGSNARVNVGGLLATTGDISNADFLGGDLNFQFQNAANSIDIQNGAQIIGRGGVLAFIAPTVTMAAGSSIAFAGADAPGVQADTEAFIGSAKSYTIRFDSDVNGLDLLSFEVPAEVIDGGIDLNGAINAGEVFVASVRPSDSATKVINLGGTIVATGAAADGGDIVLSGAGGLSRATGNGQMQGVAQTGSGTGLVNVQLVTPPPPTPPAVPPVLDFRATSDIRIVTNGSVSSLTRAINQTGAGSIDIKGSSVNLGLLTGENVSLTATAGSVGAAGLTIGGDYTVEGEDVLGALGANIGAGRTFTINDTAGGIAFTGLLSTAGTLNITSSGGVSSGLAIDGLQGVSITGASLALASINGGGADVTLTATGGAVTAAAITGRNVSLSAGTNTAGVTGAVTASGNYSVSAGDLSGAGTLVLTGVAGDVSITDTSGGASFRDLTSQGSLTLKSTGGPLTVTGALSSVNEGVVLSASGLLDIRDSVTGATVDLTGLGIRLDGPVQTAGALTFDAKTGSISQSQAFRAGTLSGTAANVLLTTSGNRIGTVAGVTSGGEVSIADTFDGMAVTGTITAGFINLTGFNGGLSLNGATLNASNNVALVGSPTTPGSGPGVTLSDSTISAGGSFSFAGATQVTGSNTLTSTGAPILFFNTVDGAGSLAISGGAEFRDEVGSSTALTRLAVTGTTLVNGGGGTSSSGLKAGELVLGAVNIGSEAAGGVTLEGTTSLTVGSANDSSAGAHSLTLKSPSIQSGSVGAGTAFGAITFDGATRLNSTITATGAVDFSGALTLGSEPHSISGSKVSFGGAVNAAALTDNTNLTVTATGTGAGDGVTFAAAVGGTTAVDSLSVTAERASFAAGNNVGRFSASVQQGGVSFANTGDLTLGAVSAANGDLSFTAGRIVLDQNVSATSGDIAFNGAVAVSSGDRSVSGRKVTFAGAVDAAGLGANLTVTGRGNGNSGEATFTGAIGLTSALAGLGVDADKATFGGATNNVGRLAANIGSGDINFNNQGSLEIGTVGGVAGVTAGNGDISISATSLSLQQGVNAGSRDVALTARTGALTGLGTALVRGDNVVLDGFAGVGAGIGVGVGTAANKLSAQSSTGSVFVNQTGAVELRTRGLVQNRAGGDYGLVSTGQVTIVDAVTANNIILQGAELVGATNANLLETNNLSLTDTSGDATFSGLTANRDLTLAATGGSLSVGSVTAGGAANGDGNIRLTSGGAMFLSGFQTAAADTVTLTAGGAIEQSQIGSSIRSQFLQFSSNGGASLTAANEVDFLGTATNTGAGNLTYSNFKALTVNGAVRNPGGISINTFDGAALIVSSNGSVVRTGSGSSPVVQLTSGAGLSLNGDVSNSAAGVALSARGDITQGADSTITAARFSGVSAGSTSLTSETNQIRTIANFESGTLTAGGGAFTLVNASDLNLGGFVSGPGSIVSNGGPVSITLLGANRSFGIDGVIDAGTGALTFNADTDGARSTALGAGASIFQNSGSLIAGSLTGVVDGNVSLTNGTNSIGTLTAFASQGLAFRTVTGLRVNGAVGAGSGGLSLVSTSSSDGVALNNSSALSGAGLINVDSGAGLTVDGLVTGGTGGVTLKAASTLDVNNTVTATGGAVNLSTTTGAITVAALAAPATATVANTGGAVSIASGSTLNVNGGVNGAGVTLSAKGALQVAAAVNAGSGVLSASTTNGGAFENTASLAGRQVNIDAAGAATIGGPVVAGADGGSIKAAGALTVKDSVTASGGTLSLSTTNGGAIQVGGAGAAVGTTVSNTGGAVNMDAAGALIIEAAVNANSGGRLAAGGNSTVGATVTAGGGTLQFATSNGGDLTINQRVSNTTGSIDLQVSGQVTQRAVADPATDLGGVMLAGTLSGNVGGDLVLQNARNEFGQLGDLAASRVLLSDSAGGLRVVGDVRARGADAGDGVNLLTFGGLTVEGSVVSDNFFVTLRNGAAGNLILDGDVTAKEQLTLFNVAPGPAGIIRQDSGVLKADALAATGSRVELGRQGNDVKSVSGSGLSGFLLRDENGLTVNNVSNSVGNVSVTTRGGDLVLAGAAQALNGQVILGTVDTGDVNLNGSISALTADLTSAGKITQASTSVIFSNFLRGSAVGEAKLVGADNAIGAVAGFAANGFTLVDSAGGLTITDAVDGRVGGVDIRTKGALAVDAGVSTTNSALKLTAADDGVAGADGIALNKAVNAGTGEVSLTSAADIVQAADGKVTAGKLTGLSVGATDLSVADNAVTELNTFGANGFKLKDADGVSVLGAVNGGAGGVAIESSGTILVDNGSLLITTDMVKGDTILLKTTAGGDILLNGKLTASMADTGLIELVSAGKITQNDNAPDGDLLTGFRLTGSAVGEARMLGPNRVRKLDDFASEGFWFRNAGNLRVVGTVNGRTGPIVIIVDNGMLEVLDDNGGSPAQILTLGGNISLQTTATGAAPTPGGIALSGAVNAGTGTVTLDSVAGVNQLSGAISGSAIKADALGAITLGGALNAGAAGDVNLKAGGAIGQNAGSVITAGTLTAQSVGDLSLDQANQIDTFTSLMSTGGGEIRVRSALDAGAGDDLITVGRISTTGGAIVTTTQSGIELTQNVDALNFLAFAGGKIDQTAGVITAGSLNAGSVGGMNFDEGNLIGTIGGLANTGGGDIFVRSIAPDVKTVGAITGGDNVTLINDLGPGSSGILTIGASFEAANDVKLFASGQLKSEGGVTVRAVAGDATLDGTSIVFANVRAGSDVIATGPNSVSFDSVRADAGDVRITASINPTGSIRLGSLFAGNDAILRAAQNLNVIARPNIGRDYNVEFRTFTGRAAGSNTLNPLFSATTGRDFLIQSINGSGFNFIGETVAAPRDVRVTSVAGIAAGAVAAGQRLPEGVATLTSNNGGAISLNANITAPAEVTITSAGALTQPGGIISTPKLTASSVGGMSLDKANVVANLASLTNSGAGGILVNDAAPAVTVGAVSGGTGAVEINATAGSMTLTTPMAANGALTLTAAGALSGSSAASATATTTLRGASVTFTDGVSGATDTIARATGGDLKLTSANAGRNLDLNATGEISVSGAAASGANSTLVSGRQTSLNTLEAGGAATLTAGGEIGFNTARAGGDLTATAASIGGGTARAGGRVGLTAGGAVSIGTGQSGGDFVVRAGSASLNSTTAGADADVQTGGATTLGVLTASRNAIVRAGGALTYNTVGAGGSITGRGGSITGGTATAGSDIDLAAGGAVRLTTATAGGDLTVSGGSLEVTTGQAGASARLTASGDAALGAISARNGDVIVSAANIGADTLSAGRDVDTTSTGSTRITAAAAGRDAKLKAGGELNLATGQAGRDLLGSGSVVSAVTATAGRDIGLTATGRAQATTATAGGDLTVSGSDVAVTTGLAGGTARVTASGAADLGRVEATSGDVVVAASNVAADTVIAGRDADINGSVSNVVSALTAARNALLRGGAVTVGTATTGGDLTASGSSITGGTLNVGRDASLTGASGPVQVSSLTIGRDLAVQTPSQARIANLNSTGANAQLSLKGEDVIVGAPAGETPADGSRLTLNSNNPGALAIEATRDATVNVTGPARVASLSAGRDVTVAARNGDAFAGSAAAGRAISVSAQNGSARLRSAALTTGGTSVAVTATGATGDAILGAEAGSVAGASERLTVPTGANVQVSGGRDAVVNLQNGFSVNALTAGRDATAVSTQGDARLGAVSGGRTVIARAVNGLVVAGSATTSGVGGAQGSNITAVGRGVSINNANAAGDLDVQATALDALVDTAVAGGDLKVVATTGAAGLRAATVTGAVAGARQLLVSGGTSATLGRAGASAPAGSLTQGDAARTAVIVRAGSGDATVDLPGDVLLTDVSSTGGDAVVRSTGAATVRSSGGVAARLSAGRDAVVQSAGAAQVANLSAGRDGSVTSTNGAATVNGARSGRNLTVTASQGAASLSNVPNVPGAANTPAAIVVQGRSASLSGGVAAREDITARATAGAVTTSGSVNAGRDVTLQSTGGSVTAGDTVTAGRAIAIDSTGSASVNNLTGATINVRTTGGAVTVAGTANASGAVTVDSSNTATLGTVQGSGVLVRASDLTLNGGITATGANGVVTLESRNGALTLGDATGGPTGGMTVDNAEAGRITAGTLKLYAGSTTGTARGDVAVGTLKVDAAKLKAVEVLAGPDATVRVTGEVTPVANATGAFKIGEAAASSGWTPRSILVTGTIGSSTTTNGQDFLGINAMGSVELNAVSDVLIGTGTFISAIQGAAPGDINVTRRIPVGIGATGTDVNRVFLTAGTATIRADGRIVQQSTGLVSERPIGMFLTNPGGASMTLGLGRTGSGAVGTPTLIDLSGTVTNQGGTRLTGNIAAASPSVDLLGFQPANTYRLNGCTIGAAGDCTPLTSNIVDVRIEKLIQGNLLQAQESPIPADPTITGAGNEEIWRSSELSEEEEE